MPRIFTLPRETALSTTVTVVAGALANFYQAGTTTRQDTYQDIALATPHANPVVADANGLFPKIYLNPNAVANYKVDITTAAGVSLSGYPVDDVPKVDIEVGVQFVATVTALKALTSPASTATYITKGYATAGDGGHGTYRWNSADTSTDNGGTIIALNAGGTGRFNLIHDGCISVTQFGAIADRTTDNLTYFNNALTAAAALGSSLYIPPVRTAGYYYKLSNVWTILDRDSIHIFGDGTTSLLVIANAASANCITVNSSQHVHIERIGIYGTSGSGNGIEVLGASHHGRYNDIWIGWTGNDGFKNTSGISTRLTNISVDMNNGYRPATLTGGLADGSTKIAYHVPHNVSGFNNNVSCFNCQANAGSSVYNLKVGDSTGSVDSFTWQGGLLQGSGSYEEVYFRVQEGLIIGAHIEPPVGNTVGWIVTFDRCINTLIQGGVVAGDARFLGACARSGFKNIRGAGVDISTTSEDCFLDDFQYGNITTGPGSGAIKDRGIRTRLKNISNAGNVRVVSGDNTLAPTTYFQTNMGDWEGGASPTVPCGFTLSGGTLTRDTAIVYSGTYSAKHVITVDLTQYLSISILPFNTGQDRYVTIEAWCYNVTTAGLARIGMAEAGTGAVAYQVSYQADRWERILVSCKADAAATGLALRLTGLTGTVYWGPIKILVDDHTPATSMTLDGTATPSISYGGYHVPLLLTSGTPTITNFLNPHVGKPFMIRFAGATVITDGDPIFLAGAANFTGAAGDMMQLIYGTDGKFRELSRVVV